MAVGAYFFVFVLGLLLGSYLNAWVWRVHEHKWKFMGRSMCVHCGAPIVWYDNIPLISFVRLRGRSRCCKKQIPQRYFWGELATGVLLTLLTAYHVFQPALNIELFLRDVFFLTILLVVFFYDIEYELVLVTVAIICGLLGAAINHYYFGYALAPLVLGALVGWAFFAVQYYGSRGKWVGGGDLWIGFMLGAWFGWPLVGVCLFIAYIVGACVAVPLLLSKKKAPGAHLPFGTFLAIAGFVTMLYGHRLLQWYLSFVQ